MCALKQVNANKLRNQIIKCLSQIRLKKKKNLAGKIFNVIFLQLKSQYKKKKKQDMY